MSSDVSLRDAAAEAKASAYIWVAAALERYVKDTLAALVQELNLRGQLVRDLRLSTCSLLMFSHLDALRHVSGLDAWLRRVDMFEEILSSTQAVFNGAVLPLDGKTIKAEHLETIWRVFGFDGPHVPHPRHRLVLKDLSECRNKLAHGEVSPVRFGRGKIMHDVFRMVEATEEIVLHVNQAGDVYLSGAGYRR
ncbi:hypothetical protein HV824_26715 [Myxococcus sp. AM009]|uniref:MAE_28990/MAE_18760 family HEPN-like nuclease n=1 Tax=Myxococcus sp. AM009 TaxID=2745137 RepID=UPI00159511B1|nr:MAE_28990/MAE_18760 family HEPN-like nuclease [Myxococcus sp. AM009]NVJ01690.1 hypothetical protein [Myxococcus sp. AM009]